MLSLQTFSNPWPVENDAKFACHRTGRIVPKKIAKPIFVQRSRAMVRLLLAGWLADSSSDRVFSSVDPAPLDEKKFSFALTWYATAFPATSGPHLRGKTHFVDDSRRAVLAIATPSHPFLDVFHLFLIIFLSLRGFPIFQTVP